MVHEGDDLYKVIDEERKATRCAWEDWAKCSAFNNKKQGVFFLGQKLEASCCHFSLWMKLDFLGVFVVSLVEQNTWYDSRFEFLEQMYMWACNVYHQKTFVVWAQ